MEMFSRNYKFFKTRSSDFQYLFYQEKPGLSTPLRQISTKGQEFTAAGGYGTSPKHGVEHDYDA
jgi:hypothetical protein